MKFNTLNKGWCSGCRQSQKCLRQLSGLLGSVLWNEWLDDNEVERKSDEDQTLKRDNKYNHAAQVVAAKQKKKAQAEGFHFDPPKFSTPKTQISTTADWNGI